MSDSVIDRSIGELTHRERFRRAMHFQTVDRIPHWEFGYLLETIDRWHAEGMPSELNDRLSIERFFGVDPGVWVPSNWRPIPPFDGDPEILQETADRRIVRLPDGMVREEKTSGVSTIPHYIRMPIADRDDWLRFKERLDTRDPRRMQYDYPRKDFDFWPGPFPPPTDERTIYTGYKKLGPRLAHCDLPVGIWFGSYYGIIRNWIGFENLSLMVYDDRDLIEEIIATLTEVYYQPLVEALRYIEVDFAAGWEDICFRNGPMISPAMFRELVGPHLKRVCGLLREHGVTVVWTDCDGDVTQLVPVWLEAGVNCLFPLEVQAGSDPVKMRRTWGRQVLLRGGIAKFKLAGSRQDILDELKRVEPIVEEGGYIPCADHAIPEDVSYENYKYYIREKLAMLGWRADEVAQVEALN